VNPIIEDELLTTLLNFFVSSMVFISIVFYALAAYWNLKFIHLVKWQSYSWTKSFIAACCIMYVFVFSYLFYDMVFLQKVDISFFSAMFIRPITLLTGAALASCARSRLTSLKSGGEEWILRKSQN
jgi:hypothetical protein